MRGQNTRTDLFGRGSTATSRSAGRFSGCIRSRRDVASIASWTLVSDTRVLLVEGAKLIINWRELVRLVLIILPSFECATSPVNKLEVVRLGQGRSISRHPLQEDILATEIFRNLASRTEGIGSWQGHK